MSFPCKASTIPSTTSTTAPKPLHVAILAWQHSIEVRFLFTLSAQGEGLKFSTQGRRKETLRLAYLKIYELTRKTVVSNSIFIGNCLWVGNMYLKTTKK